MAASAPRCASKFPVRPPAASRSMKSPWPIALATERWCASRPRVPRGGSVLTNPEKMSRDDLIEEVLFHRAQAQFQRHDEHLGALICDFGMTANQARVVLAMFMQARPCSRERLESVTVRHDRAHDIIPRGMDVLVCHARRKLGAGSILNQRTIGYSLSE